MRKALLVGVDHYNHLHPLTGCVTDAHSVRAALERHADGTLNFTTPRLIAATGPDNATTRSELKSAIRELFADEAEIALFYFAGHGYLEDTGGYICASDTAEGDDGVALSEIMTLANNSPAANRIVILDSCHSGALAENPVAPSVSEISDGVTILTASTPTQSAFERPGGGAGVYTHLLVDALGGAAANLRGEITPGSVYAHIDQSLGPWAQRPVFKTNVRTFVSLRTTEPPISLEDLRALTRLFPAPDQPLPLDPTYEPERTPDQLADPTVPDPDPVHTTDFKTLQNCVKVNLVRPVGYPHMWHAAMNSTACELTALGQHYWNLLNERLI